jgi:hypothetical protein
MEHLEKFSIDSIALNFDSSVSILKLELSSLFGLRVACELARASSLIK